jgi:predicted PurR-regulated permease PerM
MLLRAVAWFLVTFGAASLLGLRVPTLLGISVAFLSLFPCFGLLLGGVLVAVAAALRWPDSVGPIIVGAVVVQALDVVLVQRRIERRSVAVRSLLLIVAVLLGWALEGVRGVVLATVAVTFVVAAVEESMRIRDGEVPDPASVVATDERQAAPQPGQAVAQVVEPLP